MANRQHSADMPFWRRTLQKTWARVCFALLLVGVMALIALPHVLRIKIEQWLVSNGAEQATIGNIDLNPFTGTASLQGVNVTRAGKTVFADSNISINLGLSALFHRHARIQSASLRDVVVDIEQHDDGSWRFGPYSTRSVNGEQQSAEPPEQPWIVDADRIELSGCRIHYTRPGLDISFFIRDAHLTDFTSGPADKEGTLSLAGQLNDAPLRIKLDSLRLTPDLALSGNISTSGLRLGDLEDTFAHTFSRLAGTTAAEGNFNLILTRDKSLQAEYTGSIELADGNFAAGYEIKDHLLTWSGPVRFRRDTDGSSAVTLDGTLEGSEISLSLPDLQLQFAEKSFAIKAKSAVSLGRNLTVSSEGTIAFSGTELSTPFYKARNDDMSWHGEALYSSAGQRIKLNGNLDLSGSELEVTGEKAATIGSGKSSWQGSVELVENESGKNLRLEGTLDEDDLEVILADSGLQYSQDLLSVTSALSIPLGNPGSAAGNAEMLVEGILLRKTDNGQELAALGKLTVENMSVSGEHAMVIDRVRTTELELTSPVHSAMSVTVPAIHLNRIQSDDMLHFAAESLVVESPRAYDSVRNKQLASLDSIRVKDITADKFFNISVADMVVHDVILFEQSVQEQQENFLQLGRLSISRPAVNSKEGLSISSIDLEDLQVNLLKDGNGNLLILRELQYLQAPGGGDQSVAEGENNGKNASPSFFFAVDAISVTGNSGITFRDHSLDLPFTGNLGIDSLQITKLDSSLPDQESEYALSGKLAKYATLTVKGTVKPFARQLALKQSAVVNNYPMIHLAPYSGKYFGFIPTQGTVNSDMNLTIADGYVDLTDALLIKKLEIKTVDDTRAEEFNSQLPLPLDSAISMLKDKKDNIKLTVPLSGPTGDIDLSIAGLIIAPLSQAILKASSTYFLYTLGPYGAAAYVGLKVGGKLMETRLPPVEFEPGKRELTADHKQYLERVAEILTDRPKLVMQLCAWVMPMEHLPSGKKTEPAGQDTNSQPQDGEQVPADLKAEEKEALLLLGNSRAEAIKDHLVQQYDIEPGRMIICLPEFDTGKDAKPRVELDL